MNTDDLIDPSKNQVFCMLPWTHMHFWPDGRAMPCCITDVNKNQLGNFNDQTIEQLWNGEPMRQLRQNMLSGRRSEACTKCYDLEAAGVETLRVSSNLELKQHLDKVLLTDDQGRVPRVNLPYLDIRFSNICNLRCRTCGHGLSSGWYDEYKARWPDYDKPRIMNINKTGDFWAQLLPHLDHTEHVHFAGGESLMTDEHYRMLDHWISKGRTDILLRYTTNFTVLDYKKRDLFDLWKHFTNIRVAASLDGSHARGEYLRKNMVWSEVVENRRRMIREIPRVTFAITPTVSLMNVLHIADFHREWVELGLLRPGDARVNILTWPHHTSVRVLPQHLKDQARQRIRDHQVWLGTQDLQQWQIDSWHSIINYMDGSDDSHLLPEFIKETAKVDAVRKESFFETFPELSSIDPSTQRSKPSQPAVITQHSLLTKIDWSGEPVLFITWQTSDVCNHRCSYCNPGNWGGKQPNTDIKAYQRNMATILAAMRDRGFRRIKLFLSGGEPTHWQGLIPMLDWFRYSSDYEVTVAVNTNLSRPTVWWERFHGYFDDVVASYHPEWVKHELFMANAKHLETRVNYLAIRMMMAEDHWDSQMARADEIFDTMGNVHMEYVPILAEMSTAAEPYDYRDKTKIDWLMQHNLRIKQTLPKPANRLANTATMEHWSDGTVQPVNSNRLAAERQNFFEGWHCDLGTSINRGINGDITLGSCGVSGVIGNIAGQLDLDSLPMTVTCSKHHCHCGTDICIPKRRA